MQPWDGDDLPMSIYDDLASFVRREDGIWGRKDVRGRLYPVNGIGQRCAKPKRFGKSEVRYSDQKRPADMSPHVWWKMMTQEERLQWWVDQPDGAHAVKVKPNLICTPVGVSSIVSNAAKSLVQVWNLHLQSYDSSTDVGCSTTSDFDDESVTDDEEGDTSCPWDDWETFVKELGQPGEHHLSSCTSSTEAVPRLPCEPPNGRSGHRDKTSTSLYPDNLRAARPVGKAEIERTPAAKETMNKEWDRLRSKYVWDEENPREWHDVRAEARRGG